jgi:hypothetical protein
VRCFFFFFFFFFFFCILRKRQKMVEELTGGHFTLRMMYEQFQNVLKMGPLGKVCPFFFFFFFFFSPVISEICHLGDGDGAGNGAAFVQRKRSGGGRSQRQAALLHGPHGLHGRRRARQPRPLDRSDDSGGFFVRAEGFFPFFCRAEVFFCFFFCLLSERFCAGKQKHTKESRIRRIARGSGRHPRDVEELLHTFTEMAKRFKQGFKNIPKSAAMGGKMSQVFFFLFVCFF